VRGDQRGVLGCERVPEKAVSGVVWAISGRSRDRGEGGQKPLRVKSQHQGFLSESESAAVVGARMSEEEGG